MGSSKGTSMHPTILGTSHLTTNYKVNNNFALRESELEEEVRRFEKVVEREKAISPPTYIN